MSNSAPNLHIDFARGIHRVLESGHYGSTTRSAARAVDTMSRWSSSAFLA